MSEKPAPVEGDPPPSEADDGPVAAPEARPPRITVASVLTGLQGVTIALLGVVMLVLAVTGEPDGVTQAVTGAVTVLLLAVLPLAAGHGLWRLRRWSRGPAVVVQILALPAAWHMFNVGGTWQLASVPLAVVAVVVLGALASPAAAEALGVVPRPAAGQ